MNPYNTCTSSLEQFGCFSLWSAVAFFESVKWELDQCLCQKYIQAAYVTHGFGIVDLIIWVLNVWVGLTRTLWTAPVVSGGLFEGWECITGTQKVLKNQLEHSSGRLLKVWELKINWVKSSKGFRICRFQEGNPADTSGHPLVYFDVSNLTLTSFAVASVW